MTDQDNNIYHIEEQPETAAQQSETAAQEATATASLAAGQPEPIQRPEPEQFAKPAGGGNAGGNGNRKLWITIAILAAIILVGATWIAATHFATSDEEPPMADTAVTDSGNVDVINYETDNTPADTSANASTAPEAAEQSDADAAKTANIAFAGTLVSSDGSSTSAVKLQLHIDGNNSVRGISRNADMAYNLSGTYDTDSHRLLIYEDGGGRFDGTYADASYSGTYTDASGNKATFNIALQ